MTDETRRPDSETDFEEPVFASEEQLSNEKEPEPTADFGQERPDVTEPDFPSGTEQFSATDSEPLLGEVEPVFPGDNEAEESHDASFRELDPAAPSDPPETEYTFGSTLDTDSTPAEPAHVDYVDQEFDPQSTASPGTGWVNIAPDSEESADPQSEREYSYFEETPAAEVAAQLPPSRKLGRTGPVWAIGGVVLVLIAGLVWLGVSRLTGSPEISTDPVSEPAVQQVASETPTIQPPTATPGPTATPAPVQLPINANVIVGDTEGFGVRMREDPGTDGLVVQIIEDGTTMVVLAADPDSEYEQYPVEMDGYLWYRMRVPGMLDDAGNPLIGWSASDFFVVENP